MPEIGNGRLDAWRASARCYRRAMNQALAARDVSESSTMNAFMPGAGSLLEAIDAYVASIDPYDTMRQARQDIIIYERAHPDVGMLQTALNVTDEWIDGLFEDAIALEV